MMRGIRVQTDKAIRRAVNAGKIIPDGRQVPALRQHRQTKWHPHPKDRRLHCNQMPPTTDHSRLQHPYRPRSRGKALSDLVRALENSLEQHLTSLGCHIAAPGSTAGAFFS